MDKSFFLSIASLTGAIVGAGVFAIPFVFSKAGLVTSLLYFFIVALAALALHLLMAEIVLRNNANHRLVGFTEKHLGKKSKTIVAVATIFGSLGSLLAYLILSGKFLALLLPLSPFLSSLLAWLIFSFCLFFGAKLIFKLNFWAELLLFLVIGLIFSFALPKVDLANFTLFDKSYLSLPFGVFLFSLVGWSAIPEASAILKDKKKLKKAVLISFLIASCFYLAFGLIVAGVSGKATTEDAFSGLALFLGKRIIFLAALFGIFNLIDSFLIVSLYFKNTLTLDLKVPSLVSFALASLLPLILFLVGVNSFIGVVGIVGIFTGLVEGIVICLIYNKFLKKKKALLMKFILSFVVLTLIGGSVFELVNHLK